jgi:MOSC domain-containing protein YiiM
MKIVSLNVGVPRTVVSHGREVTTGIFKSAVPGPIMLRRLNLDGDRQADLENHGGRDKAVYAYPSEHYEFWRRELPGRELPWGMFGENLTTEGLNEENACIGDRFRIGGAVVKVTQPRIPCYKLGIRFGRDDMVRRFLASFRSGIYFSVFEEGCVHIGDSIEKVHQSEHGITVAEINRVFVNGSEDLDAVRRIVRLQILPSGLQNDFIQQLIAAQSLPSL